MPELLLELFGEEIPSRMQMRGCADLKHLVLSGLKDAGLTHTGAQAHATPRRLVLSVEGLPAKADDIREERKGPRLDAPEKAIEGFLKATGLSLEQCRQESDDKGAYYVGVIERPGRRTSEIVATLVPEIIRKFPWPKSMRWGSGNLRWVRPLHSILCCFDDEVVEFAIADIVSGNVSYGHRFMAPGAISAVRLEDFALKLRKARVMLDAEERADTIRGEARNLAFAQGLKVIEDDALLRETAGLVEWPTVLMGEFDEAFLQVPAEVIVSTIKTHQKCFSLRQKSGELTNRYLLVSNMVAQDGGERIIKGNDRVIAARLADAKFFWETDKKSGLADRLPQLDKITFHAKLGTQSARVGRMEDLAGMIAENIGAEADGARLAARLCKADLVSGMVGEFPELQGLMGGYYAREEGLGEDIATAIRDHYKPQGPSDPVPENITAQTVALADKIDTLAGFWAIDEKPTGSKDPYALRRAALGVIRIILEGELRLDLSAALAKALELHRPDGSSEETAQEGAGEAVTEMPKQTVPETSLITDLMVFFADRLKVYLREKGARHDLIDAVFALGDQDDLLMVVKRIDALSSFLATSDGHNLLAGVKRASNILRIEEKKEAEKPAGERADLEGSVLPNLLVQGEEKDLHRAIQAAGSNAKRAIDAEDFEAAMRAIAKLRQPVDIFFDKVTVNTDDPNFRENRLKLLNRIRIATATVADFSRIEG